MSTIEKRRSDNGSVSYRVKVRLKEHPTETATFARITDAKRWAQQIESAIREGRHFRLSESTRRTLSNAIDRYEQTHLGTLKSASAKDRRFHLAWWKEQLGSRYLANITPSVITEKRDDLAAGGYRGKGRGPATVNRYLSSLSTVLTLASREWHWLDRNPCEQISAKKEPRGRTRFLSDAERTRLLSACKASTNPYLYPIVVLALSTGARHGEILGLRWPQVDLGRRVATLLDTKNGEIRALPLSGLALELTVERAKVRRLDTDLLFPGARGNPPTFGGLGYRHSREPGLRISNFTIFDILALAISR